VEPFFEPCQVALFPQRAFPDGDDMPALIVQGVFILESAVERRVGRVFTTD
jgi:hypothetical protein